MDQWYHVTPIFLLGNILRHGGLQSGSDLDSSASPRRESSRADDDMPVEALGGIRPADCIMFFTTANPPLLRSKMASRGGRWKAFPHIVIQFSAAQCLAHSGGAVFASTDNVGRTLRRGETPDVRRFTSYIALYRSGAREVLIPASSLPDRTMPISAATKVQCFSAGDCDIINEQLNTCQLPIPVDLVVKHRYVQAQSEPPASAYLENTKLLYAAYSAGEHERYRQLMTLLSRECFD